MHLVTYAYSLKSNHERVQVQLEEPIYTKVTLRLISRLAWSMQPRSAFRLCQRAKPSLTPWYRYCYRQFSKPNHGLSSCWSLPKQSFKKRRPGAGVYLRALVVESDPPWRTTSRTRRFRDCAAWSMLPARDRGGDDWWCWCPKLADERGPACR